MKSYIATIRGVSPYSQSKAIRVEKLAKEGSDAFEKRTWRERLHVTSDGFVFIPPMSIKNCLSEAAKYLSIQIPGKGKATYTKHFEAGVLVTDPVILPIKKEEVLCEEILSSANGIRGGAKKVWKQFPVIHNWGGDVMIAVLDETITDDVLRHHLVEAGKFIGIGRFRPRNNGYYGRFEVTDLVQV